MCMRYNADVQARRHTQSAISHVHGVYSNSRYVHRDNGGAPEDLHQCEHRSILLSDVYRTFLFLSETAYTCAEEL